MDLLPVDDECNLVGAHPPLEFVFPLPTNDAFRTVNAAVFYTLRSYVPQQYSAAPAESVEGAAAYDLACDGTPAQLFVLHVSPTVAQVALQWMRPTAEGGMWNPSLVPDRARRVAEFLLRRILEEIRRLLHTQLAFNNIIPPMPSRVHPDAVVIWQFIYYPEMGDKELETKSGINRQTLANHRSLLGLSRRVREQPEQKTGRGRVRG